MLVGFRGIPDRIINLCMVIRLSEWKVADALAVWDSMSEEFFVAGTLTSSVCGS